MDFYESVSGSLPTIPWASSDWTSAYHLNQILINLSIITTVPSHLKFRNYEGVVKLYHLLLQFEVNSSVAGRITRAAFRERVSAIVQILPRAARLRWRLYSADRTTEQERNARFQLNMHAPLQQFSFQRRHAW
jgi:hypothetical protein